MRGHALAWPTLLVLAGLLLANGGAAAASGSALDAAALWDGFAASGGEPYGPAVNPAALSWNEQHALRVLYAGSADDWAPGAVSYVYFEPDTGLGAGQLGYVRGDAEAGGVKEYIYSAAWRDGDASFGFNLRHVTLASASGWAADLGVRGQWGARFGVGLVVRNAVVAGGLSRGIAPVEVRTGLSVDLGRGLLFTADYVASDAERWSAEYRYGLEARLGRLLARIGQRIDSTSEPLLYFGFGFLMEAFRIDVTFGQRAHERMLSLGLSLYF